MSNHTYRLTIKLIGLHVSGCCCYSDISISHSNAFAVCWDISYYSFEIWQKFWKSVNVW